MSVKTGRLSPRLSLIAAVFKLDRHLRKNIMKIFRCALPIVTVIAFTFSLFEIAQPIQAAGGPTFFESGTGTCNSTGVVSTFTYTWSNFPANAIAFVVTSVNQTTINTYSFPWGPTSGSFSGPFNPAFAATTQPYTVTEVDMISAPGAASFNVIFSGKCIGGVYTETGSITFNSVLGPQIPTNFVQKGISCTTAVYDMPAGKPVGSNVVTAGQT